MNARETLLALVDAHPAGAPEDAPAWLPVGPERGPLRVYPKSAATLHEQVELMRRLTHALASLIAAVRLPEQTQPATLELAQECVVQTTAVSLWVMLHPGPGLPYATPGAPDCAPAWCVALARNPDAVRALIEVDGRVNGIRMRALGQLLPKFAPLTPPDSVGGP